MEIRLSAAPQPFNVSAESLTQINKGEGDGCSMLDRKMGWCSRFSSTQGGAAQPGVRTRLKQHAVLECVTKT